MRSHHFSSLDYCQQVFSSPSPLKEFPLRMHILSAIYTRLQSLYTGHNQCVSQVHLRARPTAHAHHVQQLDGDRLAGASRAATGNGAASVANGVVSAHLRAMLAVHGHQFVARAQLVGRGIGASTNGCLRKMATLYVHANMAIY